MILLGTTCGTDTGVPPTDTTPGGEDTLRVRLTTSVGDIELHLLPELAPLAVANFLAYLDAGYYDNTRFHAVVAGERLDAGRDDADGTTLQRRPPIASEKDDSITVGFGTVSTLLDDPSDPDSASSQFRIHLDGSAAGGTVFATVVDGLETIEAIAAAGEGEPVVIQTATRLSTPDDLTLPEPPDGPLEDRPDAPDAPDPPPDDNPPVDVRIAVENFGDIDLTLFPEQAPQTVARFLALVDEGFFDNTQFHRVIEGFVVQAGAQDADDNPLPDRDTVPGEADNGLSNVAGTVSTALLSGQPDSFSASFFINTVDNTQLDFDAATNFGHTVFGEVSAGFDVAQAIERVATNPANDQPIDRVIIESITRLPAP